MTLNLKKISGNFNIVERKGKLIIYLIIFLKNKQKVYTGHFNEQNNLILDSTFESDLDIFTGPEEMPYFVPGFMDTPLSA